MQAIRAAARPLTLSAARTAAVPRVAAGQSPLVSFCAGLRRVGTDAPPFPPLSVSVYTVFDSLISLRRPSPPPCARPRVSIGGVTRSARRWSHPPASAPTAPRPRRRTKQSASPTRPPSRTTTSTPATPTFSQTPRTSLSSSADSTTALRTTSSRVSAVSFPALLSFSPPSQSVCVSLCARARSRFSAGPPDAGRDTEEDTSNRPAVPASVTRPFCLRARFGQSSPARVASEQAGRQASESQSPVGPKPNRGNKIRQRMGDEAPSDSPRPCSPYLCDLPRVEGTQDGTGGRERE